MGGSGGVLEGVGFEKHDFLVFGAVNRSNEILICFVWGRFVEVSVVTAVCSFHCFSNLAFC